MDDLLTISEVAKRSGVAASALRFYEDRDLITSERAGSGHRRYPRSVLRRIAFIVFAQRIGLTLSEIAGELSKLPPDRAPTRSDWSRLSSGWTSRIDERIAELEQAARRAHRVHRVRLPLAGPLQARQPERPGGKVGPRPALLGRRPAPGLVRRHPGGSRPQAAPPDRWTTRSARPAALES